MSSSHRLLKTTRLLHLYLGVFASPALIFFSITGGLQTFSFHETTRGSSYKPPQILVELGQLHKKQTLVVPKRNPPPAAAAEHEAHDEVPVSAPAKKAADSATPAPPVQTPPAKQKNLIPMKVFFVLIAFSLLISTLTGLYMSYKFIRNKLLVTACLLGGIVVPALLLLV